MEKVNNSKILAVEELRLEQCHEADLNLDSKCTLADWLEKKKVCVRCRQYFRVIEMLKGGADPHYSIKKKPIKVSKSYKQKYDELDDKISQLVLRKYNDEMEKMGVGIAMMPISLGKIIGKFQSEVIDWYEENKE